MDFASPASKSPWSIYISKMYSALTIAESQVVEDLESVNQTDFTVDMLYVNLQILMQNEVSMLPAALWMEDRVTSRTKISKKLNV